MTQQQQTNKENLLRQLIGEWHVGVAVKTGPDQVVAGCGDMTAVETDAGINGEINTQIEGYEEYYENDIWSYDPAKDEVRLYMINSEGDKQDFVGKWKDPATLELEWHGTFEDQDHQKRITVKWVNNDQIELRETNYRLGKPVLQTDYVFKRKEATQASKAVTR